METVTGAETEVETDMETGFSETGTSRLVDLIQVAFQEGCLEEEFTWQAVVIIPKGGGDYQGIVLLEVVWKVVTVILNRHLTNPIAFHNVFHGF